MSGIEEFRQRVQDAEQHFGLAREEQVKYSARLIGLIDTVEDRLREQQAKIEAQQAAVAGYNEALAKEEAQIGHLEVENEHLRGMLHSLLQAIETGGRSGASEIMQTLEQKVGALIADGGASAEVVETEAETTLEQPDETVAESISEAAPESETDPATEMTPEQDLDASLDSVEQNVTEEAEETAPVQIEELDGLAAEAVAEPRDEPAEEIAAEAFAEPQDELAEDMAAEAIAEPQEEPTEEIAAEAIAEPQDEPAEDIAAEAVAEPQDEPAEAASTEEVPDDTSGDDYSTQEALEDIASALAVPSAGSPDSVSDSLHEIMNRVSKLVRDSDSQDSSASSPETDPSSEKKTAAG
jgi:hypothetical protein